MRSSTLHLELAGEVWAVETPEQWASRFRTAFAHIATGAAEPAVRIVSRCSASEAERRWASALTAKLPDEHGIAAIESEAGRVHVSRMSIDRWDRRTDARESILLDPLYESEYLGANLLLRHIAWRACERGLVPIHAAAVAGGDGFWLIPAGAGQGKSTLAAAAMAGGLTVLSDDFVLFDPRGRTLHSLYGMLRLAPAGHRLVVEHFGEAALTSIGERDDEKLLLAPATRPTAFASSGRLCGILLLQRTGRVRMADAVGPTRALQAFASSLRLLPTLAFPAAIAFRHFADIARSLECRVLETGPDLTRLVRCLRDHAGCGA